ncbi:MULTISPECIES: hypothetical protein [Planococcus]|uniref:hypothetical protein n=1 Tax=Planococcus TaxID=1372 RepID=UPI00115F1BF3|nr:hypothetical protein [Planococcus soli]
MKKKNVLKVVGSSGLALSLLLSSNAGVYASSPTAEAPTLQEQHLEKHKLTKEDVNHLKSFLTEYGVEEPVQQKLIAKIRSGKLWDSLNESSEIVNSKTVEKDDGIETIETFNDGSVKITTIDPAKVEEGVVKTDSEGDVITPLGVTPGTISTGTGYATYSNAKVYMKTGIADAHFYANFTLLSGSSKDYISSVRGAWVGTFGGTANNISLSIIRKYETLDNPAQAQLKFQYVAAGGTASSIVYLTLRVANNLYTGYNN